MAVNTAQLTTVTVEKLHLAAVISSGAYSSRPAAKMNGNIMYTDKKILYFSLCDLFKNNE